MDTVFPKFAADFPKPALAGVVNITPDSFSDGGLYFEPHKAVSRIKELQAQGASIIDIGGESTRPGSDPVSAEEEWRRIEPALKQCAAKVFISVDTQKGAVANKALSCGAQMINDVSALRFDPALAAAVAAHDAFLVLMYSAYAEVRPPKGAPPRRYGDLIAEIAAFLRERIGIAVDSGVDPRKILVDPGMGAFVSPDPADSWEILGGISRFRELGVSAPIMVGISRKGFLGGSRESRDALSQLAAVQAVRNGAQFVRTHNVLMAKDLLSGI